MSSQPLGRRKFNELSAAAVGGLVAGSLAGCGKSEPPAKTGTPPVAANTAAAGEKHLCRGLNDCKGQGPSGKNDCRGQGDCATVEHHSCGPQNDCKGQGGCGANAGANDCKGKGGCHVPLMDAAWKTVRDRKEGAWSKASEKFGDAPAKKEPAEQETPAQE
jgi:hypothetical protein